MVKKPGERNGNSAPMYQPNIMSARFYSWSLVSKRRQNEVLVSKRGTVLLYITPTPLVQEVGREEGRGILGNVHKVISMT